MKSFINSKYYCVIAKVLGLMILIEYIKLSGVT